MLKLKKFISLILIFVIFFYCLFTLFFNNKVLARERNEDISNLINYPEIYTAVQELKTAHPNWTFTILYTGLDWNTVIYNETTALHTRSLVHNSLVKDNISEWVCEVCGTAPKDNGSWYCASNKTVSYYMDPRNWLNETYIFAYETLSFNGNVHNVEGVQAILSGTFMDKSNITYTDTNGHVQVINKSYAQVIYEAGQKNNVSPYHLAARIRQEQGSGTSSLISGTYSYTNSEGTLINYTGYYNYFNIAASGSGDANIIRNGLERAKEKGWTNPELSINGGAEFLKGGYIGNYQDTLYLQKYHVDSNSKYSIYGHQYQQNVSAPYTESLDVYDAYEDLGILESNFNFIVPVYENMTAKASEKPGRIISLQTENVVVQTESTDLSIRSGPSTDYYIKAKVPKGSVLTRIERAEQISNDGRYWDRVVYNTGSNVVIGYATREYLVDAPTTETVNEDKTIETMCNLRNGPATTNTRVKQILPVGTQVTVIDKLSFPVDGHIWYRVKLADGTQGYVSAAYIQKETVATEKYRIEGDYVKISPTTKIEEIPEAVLTSGVYGTGGKVKIGEKEYTLVMIGDVSGDGQIKSKDYMMIKNYIMKTLTLTDIEKAAADVSKDAEIKSKDYMMIKNHIMGISLINI